MSKFELPTEGWAKYRLMASIISSEGNLRSFVEALEGEKMIADYRKLYLAMNVPNWVRPLLVLFLDKRRASLLKTSCSGGISAYEVWQLMAVLTEMRRKWADAMKDFVALVFPALPIPAPPHGTTGELTDSCSCLFIAAFRSCPHRNSSPRRSLLRCQ
mgnify:FL=1